MPADHCEGDVQTYASYISYAIVTQDRHSKLNREVQKEERRKAAFVLDGIVVNAARSAHARTHLLVKCTKIIVYLNTTLFSNTHTQHILHKQIAIAAYAPKEWKTRRACSVRAGCPESMTHLHVLITPHLRHMRGQ